MREGQFIKKNKERWDQYKANSEDPDELAKRFTYLVDDLSYAKTHYPFSKVVQYINGIAASIYLSIYKNKKERSNRIGLFFSTELPLILYKQRRILLFAFLFFLTFIAIGIFSAWKDPSFVRGVLGDSYVNMTEANIAKGDPFGVYKNEDEFLMFVQIAWNNIRVSLLCFAFGIFCSLGTVWMLFRNGLMVGVFEQMFFANNVGFESILVVFIHGTMELSSIVIAGAAGMMMGNAILFPKTYSRAVAFKQGAREGIKVLISLIPIFIVAAFFEGYLTRHTEMPLWASISILTMSLVFILWYYVWYPVQVHRRSKSKEKTSQVSYLLS